MSSSRVPEYIALSHCWGGDVVGKLTTKNYAALRRRIFEGPDSLPQTFIDAIKITREMGLRHLWIDSLCILQDSPSDWAGESPTMGQVFSSAHCVIAATASENSRGGCFRDRPSFYTDVSLLHSDVESICHISTPRPSTRTFFGTRVETAPLTKRAWAFQERLLSRRVVHFCSDVILFECNTVQASEFHPKGIGYETEQYEIHDGKLVAWLKDRVSSLTGRSVRAGDSTRAKRGIRGALDVLKSLGPASGHRFAESVEFCKRWFDIVAAYTEGALTRQTDKLIALSGVAELVQRQGRAPYLAGLWETGVLALQLLWVVREPLDEQPLYCAPSWSWASVNGLIALLPLNGLVTAGLDNEAMLSRARIETARVFYQGQPVSEARSLVDSGYLVITAPAAEGFPSEDARTIRVSSSPAGHFLSAKSRIGRGKLLQFLPDSHSPQPPGSQILALHIMTVHHPDNIRKQYGLVLRLKRAASAPNRAPATYERVGLWWTTTSLPPRGNKASGSSEMFSTWSTGSFTVE
jgi:hypothetical protein